MSETGGNGGKSQFTDRSILQPVSTDFLRAKPSSVEAVLPDSPAIQTIKNIFGKVVEADPEFTNDIRGAGQDYENDKFWIELTTQDERLYTQFGKFYPSHEEFSEDSLKVSLENTLSVLEQRAREREVLQEGLIDPLTGLTNKRYFEKIASKRVERARKSGRKVSILRIDIDDFKGYNDNTPNGHDHGDMVIKRVADKLVLHTRMTDDVARLGGDESVILLYDTTEEDALEIADRLQTAIADDVELRKPDIHGNFTSPGSLSIGITSLRGRNITLKELDSEADKAAYNSKKNGKARATLYQPGMEGKLESSPVLVEA